MKDVSAICDKSFALDHEKFYRVSMDKEFKKYSHIAALQFLKLYENYKD